MSGTDKKRDTPAELTEIQRYVTQEAGTEH